LKKKGHAYTYLSKKRIGKTDRFLNSLMKKDPFLIIAKTEEPLEAFDWLV
jgi:hypothetical protein